MAKIRYLVGKGEDRKLKRNIPKRLQGLAGKTAWVERVGKAGSAKLKEQAHRFAFWTDGELNRLEALTKQATISAPEDAPSVELDRLHAEQIAVAYFRERYERMLEDGSLLGDPHEPNYASILLDAVEDQKAALASASGSHVDADPRALKLLVEHGRRYQLNSRSGICGIDPMA